MVLEDYLQPGEEIKFQSTGAVRHGNKPYQVVMTDRRILLYARRGLVSKSDDVVTQKFADLQGIKYSEKGLVGKTGTIHIQGLKTDMQLTGSAAEVKALYQSMMQFL